MNVSYKLASVLTALAVYSSVQARPWTYTVGGTPQRLVTDMAACNYDNDGRIELAVASYAYDPVSPGSNGGKLFVLSQGMLGLSREWTTDLVGGFQCVLWADVDGDGDQDLVAGSSVLLEEDRPVVCFLNNDGMLSQTPTVLVEGHWDVMDLEFGNFTSECDPDEPVYPDLLIMRADGCPYVLSGSAGSGGAAWSLLAGGNLHEVPFGSHSILDREMYRASVWEYEPCDGILDFVAAGQHTLCRCTSSTTSLPFVYDCLYPETKIGYSWISIAHVPPCDDVSAVSTLVGQSWDQGVMKVFTESMASDGYLRLPSSEQYYVEFVADVAVVSAVALSCPLRVSVAEVGALSTDPPEPRRRYPQVFQLIPASSGWTASQVQEFGSVEAYCTEWYDIDRCVTAPPVTIEMSGANHLFQVTDGTDLYRAFIPVYKIVSAVAVSGEDARPVHAWYSGNGWFGVMEPMTLDETLVVQVISSNSPDVFYGALGSVIGYPQ
jgi:hypothetical protein